MKLRSLDGTLSERALSWRVQGGGGRGFRGGGDRNFTLSFPGFRGAVKWLVLANVGVYFALLLLELVNRGWVGTIHEYGRLLPLAVTHGYVYQLVTYGFLHRGLMHVAGNMFQLWMFGTALEDIWGKRKFYQFYFVTLIGAGIITVLVAYTHILGMAPTVAVEGASGAIMAILVAFGIIFAEQQIFLFPFPIAIKAKYFAIILVLLNLAFALGPGGFVAYATHLGGALCGFLYVKFGPRGAVRGVRLSESYYGLRNAYYKWKRRRAGKKFEVYMRKHDRGGYFDEHGNYKPPDEKKGNGEGGRGGWVN